MITPGLLTDLRGSEPAGSISVRGPRAGGGDRDVEAFCPPLFNGVILLKVMTQSCWDFHSAFRCSLRQNMLMNRFLLFNIAELLVEGPLIC